MESATILMTVALGLSAILMFGGGILLSKALRFDKPQGDEAENKKQSSTMLITASVMIAAGLIFCGGTLISHALRTDNVQERELRTAEETTSNVSTESTTTIENTTATMTTTTEQATMVETTTTEAPLLPINEVYPTNKEISEYGFIVQPYSDDTLSISGINLYDGVDSDEEYLSYGTLYGNGSHETVIIPNQIKDQKVRAITLGQMNNYEETWYWEDWEGVTTIVVPDDMDFVYEADEILVEDEEYGYYQVIYDSLTFDEASSIFSEHGIILTKAE